MVTSQNFGLMAQNPSHHSEIYNFFNDDRNLRMYLVLLHKNFTWNRELRGFGFSDRQIKYSIEFLINKGLIIINNLEDLDIKIIELIASGMPYGNIHADLQVYTLSDKGKEWAYQLEQYIGSRINEFSELINKVSKKIQNVLPLYNKLVEDESCRFYRELSIRGDNGLKLYIETPKNKEFKQLQHQKASKGGYLTTTKQNTSLTLYEEKSIKKAESGIFYNGSRISNIDYEQLTKEVDKTDLENGYVGNPALAEYKDKKFGTFAEAFCFSNAENNDKECFEFLNNLEK